MLSLLSREFITSRLSPRHQSVGPAFFVAIEFQRLPQGQILERRCEQVRIPPLPSGILAAQPLGRIGQNGCRIHLLMDMARNRVHEQVVSTLPVQVG